MAQLTTKRVCFIVLGLHLFLVLVRPINDPDIWWHLRTGQYILQSFHVPRTDIYSFTAFGRPWIAPEWLLESVMYALYYLFGWIGLNVISALVSALVFLYVARHCQAPAQIVLVAAIASQTAALVVLRDPRPRLATLIFSAVFLVVLRNYTRSGTKRLWILPPLMIAWVNLHPGYPVGLVLILLAGIASVLGKNRKRLPHLASIFVLCLIAISVNPYGLRMYTYPFETQYSAIYMSIITEWNAPDFRDYEALPFLLLILGIISVLGLSEKKISSFDLLSLMMVCFLSLRSKRHVSLLSLVSIPVLAEHSWNWISSTSYGRRIGASQNSRETLLPVLLILVILIIHLPAVLQTIRSPINMSEKPVAAIRFMQEQNLPNNVFSKYEWNDYLVWASPSKKVFIDGRDVYGDKFLMEFFRLYTEGQDWEAAFQRFGVNTVMVEPSSPLSSLIRGNTSWSEVYDDRQAVIFVRK